MKSLYGIYYLHKFVSIQNENTVDFFSINIKNIETLEILLEKLFVFKFKGINISACYKENDIQILFKAGNSCFYNLSQGYIQNIISIDDVKFINNIIDELNGENYKQDLMKDCSIQKQDYISLFIDKETAIDYKNEYLEHKIIFSNFLDDFYTKTNDYTIVNITNLIINDKDIFDLNKFTFI
jgi:hypothetical protein